jgi:hypothetical protein
MGFRARIGFAGFVLCVVIAALGPAVSARAGEIGTTPAEQCNVDGRAICLTVKTFENITASDPTRPTDGKRFTWVEWTLRNGGGTTLTHPTVTVSFADLCGAGLADCSGASTAQFQTPATPDVCSVSGGNLVCVYPNLPAGAPAATTRAYFKTADKTATRDVRATRITVLATVNERGSDQNCEEGDPNCDTFAVPLVNSYEPDPDGAFTFALNGNRFHLPTNDGLSSFTFTSASPSVFLTSFKKLSLTDSAAFCFSDVVCFDRALSVDTQSASGFGASNPVVFYTRLSDPPSGITTKSLNAIHFYDAVALTSAANRLTPGPSPSFARMDGLSVGTAAAATLGIAEGKYFVVDYQATGPNANSFRLSLTKDGAPIPIPGAGTVQAAPIRIIGDQSDERSTTLCTTTIPSPIPALPKICVAKAGSKALDSYVWDTGNGFVQH